MAIDKRLQIYDEQGNLVDYDILASDVKFLPDGKDLPTKFAELEDEIEDAGSGDGTVTGVKVNGTTHDPNEQGVVDIGTVITQHQDISGLATKTELAGKVDKNGTDSLMTAAEHTKLTNLPTVDQLATQMNAKANDNAVVKTISVNGGAAQTPVNGNVALIVEGGGSVESVTVSGTKYTPNINGDVDLGDLRGQDGNSGVASADGVESVNNLNGGTTDTSSKVYVLGANQGKRLRDQIDLIYQRIQTLYGLLGNIAFWDGKPSASALLPDLDWGAPKHAVAITNSLSNSVITRNGEPVSSSFQAEEGSTVTLIVAPASGYALTNVSYVKDGGSSTSATSLGDGTYKIEFVMGGSDVAITVSGTVVATVPITYGTPTHCAVPIGVTNPGVVESGGTVNVQYECDNGYQLSAADITISGATIGTITSSGNVFTIPITHDGTSQSISITATASVPPMKLLKGYYIGADNDTLTNAAVGNGTTVDVNKVVLTDYIHIAGNEDSVLANYFCKFGVNRNEQKSSVAGPPCCGSFFRKQNGVYKLIHSWSWSNSIDRTVSPSNFSTAGYDAEILAALKANELYVRAAMYLDSLSPDTLVSGCTVRWNNVALFSDTDNYTTTTDQTEFDSFTTS